MVNSLVRESKVKVNLPENYEIVVNGPIPEEEIGTIEIPETLPPINDISLWRFLGFIDRYIFEYHAVQHYIDGKQHRFSQIVNTRLCRFLNKWSTH